MATIPGLQRTEPSPTRNIALDSTLKYVVLLSGLAFGSGYQVLANYYALLKIPWDTSGSETPRILWVGATCLLYGVFGAIFLLDSDDPIYIFRRNVTPTIRWALPGLFTFAASITLWFEPNRGYNVVRCEVFYLVSVYFFAGAAHYFSAGKDRRGIASMGFLVVGTVFLTWAASYNGVVLAQSRTYEEPDTRLLLTADMTEIGQRGLRLSVGNGCLVSEPVSVAAILNDTYYLILPNRTTMAIPKGKVIGVLAVRSFW